MNKQHLYAFYGSLREGMYNRVGVGSAMKHIKTTTIEGFKLYNLAGAYPCAIRTNDPNDKMVVDLYEITNATREYGVHRMELGAGYDYDEVEIDGTNYGIYTYDKSYMTRLSDRYIPGGDWVKYLRKEREHSQEI